MHLHTPLDKILISINIYLNSNPPSRTLVAEDQTTISCIIKTIHYTEDREVKVTEVMQNALEEEVRAAQTSSGRLSLSRLRNFETSCKKLKQSPFILSQTTRQGPCKCEQDLDKMIVISETMLNKPTHAEQTQFDKNCTIFNNTISKDLNLFLTFPCDWLNNHLTLPALKSINGTYCLNAALFTLEALDDNKVKSIQGKARRLQNLYAIVQQQCKMIEQTFSNTQFFQSIIDNTQQQIKDMFAHNASTYTSSLMLLEDLQAQLQQEFDTYIAHLMELHTIALQYFENITQILPNIPTQNIRNTIEALSLRHALCPIPINLEKQRTQLQQELETYTINLIELHTIALQHFENIKQILPNLPLQHTQNTIETLSLRHVLDSTPTDSEQQKAQL